MASFSSPPPIPKPLEDDEDSPAGNSRRKYIPLQTVYSATAPSTSSSSAASKNLKPRKPQKSKHRDQFKRRTVSVKPRTTVHVYTRRRKSNISKPSFFDSLGFGVRLLELEAGGEVEGVEDRIKKRRRLGNVDDVIELNDDEEEEEEGEKEGEEDCEVRPKLIEGVGTRIKSRKRGRLGNRNEVIVLDDDDDEENEDCKDQPRLVDSFDECRNLVEENREVTDTVVDNNVDEAMIGECDSMEKDVDSSEGVVIKNKKKKKKEIWDSLKIEGTDPMKFIGLQCKVYWPLDASWYHGNVVNYNLKTGRHHVKYEDNEEEHLILSNERIKFHLSFKEMQKLKLEFREKSSGADEIDVNEMMTLAATLDDCQEIDAGDIIWAKLTGHAIWPAIVLDESQLDELTGLNKISEEKSVIVHFFGTHDFARVARKQVFSFLKGLFLSCHLKCKKPAFLRGLEEAKIYLSEQKLPKRMMHLRDGIEADTNSGGNGEQEDGVDSVDEDCTIHNETKKENLKSFSFEAGELQILSLGRIAEDTCNFQNERFIWSEGYTAVRMFPSIIDSSVDMLYKMEVLRDADTRTRPLFRVTADNEEEFDGLSPSACWNKIYNRIRALHISNQNDKADLKFASGSYMFGFSDPEISKVIKEMPKSKSSSKSSNLASSKSKDRQEYRPVYIEWRDHDRCNVCHMDDEYENNLFLQCDKCRMMVHARCYGEVEPANGILWFCNLCRPGAPKPPPCHLCPVVGGAMKPTTDDSWAHLACAIWIPETCLADIKKMEPIDGTRRISKDRRRLLCSICHVYYGACIQCSNSNCRVSYHPLCARAAGYCLEAEGIDPFDEDDEDQCIQLLSFCRKHRPSSTERVSYDERHAQNACERAECIPQSNPSGCARTEPYNFLKRRGRNEPEILAAVSSKRLYVENKPHLIGGCSPHMSVWSNLPCNKLADTTMSYLEKLQTLQPDPSTKILSLADKYNYMRDTFRKRLAFGKSGIHGFGVFTKLPHRAGDMVIEYTGELIRAPVADRREHLIYNSLVGAGTYMFRIDDERVIDATKAGSIAHLINHSCEPNCYSRVIRINGDDHIIIFAKREIKQWEELTYDYRFVSSDERLACYCGFSRCRGIVNDIEAEERVAKLYVPRADLNEWQGE